MSQWIKSKKNIRTQNQNKKYVVVCSLEFLHLLVQVYLFQNIPKKKKESTMSLRVKPKNVIKTQNQNKIIYKNKLYYNINKVDMHKNS